MAALYPAWNLSFVARQVYKQAQSAKLSSAKQNTHALTQQSYFEPNLRQRLHEHIRLIRRNVSTRTQHIQPVNPIRPARLVRRDLVRERGPARAEQRERQLRGQTRRAGNLARVVAHDDLREVERRAGTRGDFADEREVDPVWEVFEPVADDELDGAVDVVEVFEAVVLCVCGGSV